MLIAVLYFAATVAVYIPWALTPAYFSDAFDAQVRYSGLSLATTIGNLFGSAIAPLIAGTLIARPRRLSQHALCFVAGTVSIGCVFLLGRADEKSIATPQRYRCLTSDRTPAVQPLDVCPQPGADSPSPSGSVTRRNAECARHTRITPHAEGKERP